MALPENIKLALELIGVDHASVTIDEAGESLRDYVEQSERAGNASKEAANKSSMSWTEFRSIYSTVLEVGQGALQMWNETVGVTVDLANTVRQFRDVTGQSAEESSRLVQVLDDYKVNVTAAEMATKKLSTEGLQFNIRTLAELSDQYLALGSDVERTTFLYDKFGKSGDQFAEIMMQGSEAILAANDAIDENLILTDKALQRAREYEKNVDSLSDSWDAFMVSLGNKALPVANNLLENLNELIDESGTGLGILRFGFDDIFDALTRGNESFYDLEDGMKELNRTAEDLPPTLDEITVSTEDLSKANQDYLSSIEDISGQLDSYNEKTADLKEEEAELLAEKQKLLDEGWWAESEAIQDINAKLEKNAEKQVENAEAFDLATKSRMLSMLQEQLAVDDLDARETDFLLQQGLEWGIYSEEAIAAMDAAQRKVDELKAQYDSVPELVTTRFVASFETAGYEGYGSGFSYATSDTQYQQPKRANATGGTYMIPMGWGNEKFPIGNSDTASGGELISITPKGKDPWQEVVNAIYATRMSEDTLARVIRENALQVTK